MVYPSHNSNGLTYDRNGRLLACEHGGRRLSRMDESGAMRPLVESYNGKSLNSPNDITVHSSGAIFFTDPPYGIDPDPGELGFNGLYRFDLSGEISLLKDDMVRPNGLAFNPDESLLYVADSGTRKVMAFPVNEDLSLGTAQLFADMDVRESGNPDGIKVDSYGHVFVASSTGIWVMESSGRYVGTIEFPELPANLAFGGLGKRVLFATARTGLYRVRVNYPGDYRYLAVRRVPEPLLGGTGTSCKADCLPAGGDATRLGFFTSSPGIALSRIDPNRTECSLATTP